jgi:hypothetical protein
MKQKSQEVILGILARSRRGACQIQSILAWLRRRFVVYFGVAEKISTEKFI